MPQCDTGARTRSRSKQTSDAPHPAAQAPTRPRAHPRRRGTGAAQQVAAPVPGGDVHYAGGSLQTAFAVQLDATPAAPLVDEVENPFLAPSSQPPANSEARAQPQPTIILDPPIESRLHAIAAPVQERPRSGPHSPNRASRSRTASSTRPSTEPPSDDERPARNRFSASDVWNFMETIGTNPQTSFRKCKLCVQRFEAGTLPSTQLEPKTYSLSTSTSTLRNHLFYAHTDEWVSACEKMQISIGSRDRSAWDRKLNKWRANKKGVPYVEPEADQIPEYSKEVLIDAIADLVVVDDLAVNLIESPRFRKLIRILRQDLRDEDIPKRTTIRKRIADKWDEYITDLREDFKSAAGRVS